MDVYELHKSNPDVFRQFSIKEVLFLYYRCPQKDKILQLHSPYNQLTFSIVGKRIFHQGDNTYIVDKNSGFLLRRAAFLQEMDDDVKGWELMAFYLKDDYLKRIFNEFRSHLPLGDLPSPPREMVINIDINQQTRNCILSLIPYFNQSGPLPEKLLEIKFQELLYNVFVNPKNQNIVSYINHLSSEHPTPIWEVMEANYMYNLTLKEYAQLANRSLSAFKREFENYYGIMPGKWLMERRLERSRTFIETTNKSISSIAFENGFCNLSHFSRVFKQRYGKAPSAYNG